MQYIRAIIIVMYSSKACMQLYNLIIGLYHELTHRRLVTILTLLHSPAQGRLSLCIHKLQHH